MLEKNQKTKQPGKQNLGLGQVTSEAPSNCEFLGS